jgi:hypothetical protein
MEENKIEEMNELSELLSSQLNILETKEDDNDINTQNKLLDLITEELYITKKINKDYDSFSYLIDIDINQSQSIQVGCRMEKFIRRIILELNNNIKDIKQKNIKNQKEKDHLFIDTKNKIIYYAELKANLNLDTEKSKSTYEKCLLIKSELEEKYPEYEIKWCLLGFRYLTNSSITTNIKNKYSVINNNLFGINDYFEMFNINFRFKNENDYKNFINNFINRIIK